MLVMRKTGQLQTLFVNITIVNRDREQDCLAGVGALPLKTQSCNSSDQRPNKSSLLVEAVLPCCSFASGGHCLDVFQRARAPHLILGRQVGWHQSPQKGGQPED